MALVSAPGAFAADNIVDIKAVAGQSGLTVRNVQMLLGHWSAFAEYRYTLPRVERTFIETFGADRYHDLMAGEPVQFERWTDDGKRVVFTLQRHGWPGS